METEIDNDKIDEAKELAAFEQLQSAQRFFFNVKQWSFIGDREETWEARRIRTVAMLAYAEYWAKSQGVTFEWVDRGAFIETTNENDVVEQLPAMTCIARLGNLTEESHEPKDTDGPDRRRVIEAEVASLLREAWESDEN